ncbi:protease inhibitor I42 family protein [Phascolarctobacterium sp.]
MRILGILLCCLMLGLSSVAFAEQLTTVYSKVVATKNMQGEIPEIDGLRYTNLQKNANSILAARVKDLLAQVGGSGTVSYEVKLNRPSLVGILLKATNGGSTAYQAVNLDMTTGNEFSIRDFVGEGNAIHEILGAYEGVLFADNGIYTRTASGAAYSNFVSYSKLFPLLRTGDAERLLTVFGLTRAVEDKVVTVKTGELLALQLESNRTTGYSWFVEEKGYAGQFYELGRSYILPGNAANNKSGMPGLEIIVFGAQEPGEYKVNLEYKRAWEKGSGFDKFSFTVKVL